MAFIKSFSLEAKSFNESEIEKLCLDTSDHHGHLSFAYQFDKLFYGFYELGEAKQIKRKC